MRIISGKLKGKSISFLKTLSTRPLKDSVKENIFNILVHSNLININLVKSNILDLYSGIGSFGLEALSRGARKVTFIEKNKNVINFLKKNLTELSLKEKSEVIEDEIQNVLIRNSLEKYDLFFLDPPFSNKDFILNLKTIKKKNYYKKNHLIIIHREKKTNDELGKNLDVLLEKNYGRSKILFAKFL